MGLGSNAYISAITAKFISKGHVLLPRIWGYSYRQSCSYCWSYVIDLTEANNSKGYDQDVAVEDVLIGSDVTLFSGVRIVRGFMVAAGAVVAKSMPPYYICCSVPAKFIKFYWTID